MEFIKQEDLKVIKTLYTKHIITLKEQEDTIIIKYEVLTNKDNLNDYFEVRGHSACVKTFHENYKDLSNIKIFNDKSNDRYNAIISIYTKIHHYENSIEFEGCTAKNIMVTSVEGKSLKSLGIGTFAFNLLIKYAKKYGRDNYTVRTLSFGRADEGKLTNYDGTLVDNKIRRHNFYSNFGFNCDNNASVDYLSNLTEYKKDRYLLTVEDMIEYFKKSTNNEIELYKELRRLKNRNSNLKIRKEEYDKIYKDKMKYMNITFLLIFVLGIILFSWLSK
jgi:hypothetical protein